MTNNWILNIDPVDAAKDILLTLAPREGSHEMDWSAFLARNKQLREQVADGTLKRSRRWLPVYDALISLLEQELALPGSVKECARKPCLR